MSSVVPSTAVATTGKPAAIASRTTLGIPSQSDGRTSAVADFISDGTSSRRPSRCTRELNASRAMNSCTWLSSGPDANDEQMKVGILTAEIAETLPAESRHPSAGAVVRRTAASSTPGQGCQTESGPRPRAEADRSVSTPLGITLTASSLRHSSCFMNSATAWLTQTW